MHASSSALSVDEFAALVAAALSDIDVCGQPSAGGINSVDGQGRPQAPPPTGISVERPRLFKKPRFESWSTSTSDPLVDSPRHSIEYTPLNIGSYFSIPFRKPQPTRMTACTSEPTVLASMSTANLGNCLCLGVGRCGSGSCAGTGSGSRNSANLVYNRNTGGNVSTLYSKANATPMIPVFTLEVEQDAGLRRRSDELIDLEPTLIGLSSSLRLPTTPSPSFRKSVPDLRQDPPRNQCQLPESPRTSRKSFFSKLKKQFSFKTTSDSHSTITSTPLLPTISFPKSNTAHSDGSPTGLLKLHLSLPLTPLSLSTTATPNPSRTPSPRFPSRTTSGPCKRESAPPTTNGGLETRPSPYNRSPNLSPIDRPDFYSVDEGKRRIHSLHDYNYAPAHFDRDSSLPGPIEKTSQEHSLEHDEQRVENNRRNRSSSILSLADCLMGEAEKGNAQMGWMMEPKKHKSKNSSKGGIEEHCSRSSQPFPTLSQPDSDEVLSEPSKYSCESAPGSIRISSSAGSVTNTNEVAFHAGLAVRLPSQTPLPTSPNHNTPEPVEESQSYAPFVPLVFQHERLQQKLQKPLPLSSIPAKDYETVACIKSVTLAPFPPRTSSLSSAVHVRQRTKSAPNTPPINSEHQPPIPTLPSHLASTTATNHPVTSVAPSKKNRKVERPTTAPANSTPNSAFPFKARGAGLIPFPVVKETELVGEENVHPARPRNSSKPKRAKPRKSLLSPSQSLASAPVELPSPLLSTEIINSNSHREGSRTGSVGLDYSLSLSKHPYAQARSLEGMSSSPEESDAKAEVTKTSRTSVTFVPSTTGESSRLQTKTQRHFNVAQNLMPPSPTSPTSHSGSGSDASTKPPVTPRSPLFWTVSGAGIAAAVKSRIGLGISSSTPASGSEECNISAERKAYRESVINSDVCVVRTSDDASRFKKDYKPPHPYSQSYLTAGPHGPEEENPTNGASPCKENPQDTVDDGIPRATSAIDDRPSTASSINRRPSTQTTLHHGVAPLKPPPVGPLPFLPGAVISGEVPLSPVPSEYTKAFSNPSGHKGNEDDDDFVSHPCSGPSYSPSQSSESYGHDPEYEALLAANTRANVGELASMRNIGVGRRLMSGHPQPPSSCIDPTSSKKEGKRMRVYSEAARHPGIGGEWTLFLGNDDTPPRREDIIADLNSVPMTGIKTLSGVRARTKSESALKTLGLRHKQPFGMKRARSSTLAPGSSTHAPPSSLPPVPKLAKKQILKSEDWTLSLPLLPPAEKDPKKLSTTEEDLSRTTQIPISDSLVRGAKSPTRYLRPVHFEGVVMGDEFNIDDADEMTIAEFQVADAPFELDIDSLDFEDDDSLPDFSNNSASDTTPNLGHLLFSVPRLVSKGSGMECAKWGEEVDEEIIKTRGRRLSDGVEGMAGVSVRVDVNEDGESVCVADGLSLNTEEVENGNEEGWRMEGQEFADPDASDATKENLARLDALSADLKRFNELLKDGVSATTAMELKHARSCGLLPSQTEVRSEHIRVQQSLDILRDPNANSASTKPPLVSVKDRVKSWTERSVSLNGPPSVPVSSSPSNPPTTSMVIKSRPPLPFAPSSPPRYSRPLGRGATLGIGVPPGRSATGRAMTIATQTKPSNLKVTAAIPDGVVGSGLKVGGNGRVISLSCSSAAAPMVPSTQAGSLRVITKETKDKRATVIIEQGNIDEDIEANGNDSVLERDAKRNSASSVDTTDSFFTSLSSPSQVQIPPPGRNTTPSKSRKSSASSSSSSPTPTATPPPGLRITASSTTNSSRAHSPVDDVHTPSSSTMPTPLASSFPMVPPLPTVLSSLGEDLKTVSRMLAGPWMSKNKTPKEAHRHETDYAASRLSSASDMSVRTIVPSSDTPLHSASEAERDTESTCSDSFYSARSSFEA